MRAIELHLLQCSTLSLTPLFYHALINSEINVDHRSIPNRDHGCWNPCLIPNYVDLRNCFPCASCASGINFVDRSWSGSDMNHWSLCFIPNFVALRNSFSCASCGCRTDTIRKSSSWCSFESQSFLRVNSFPLIIIFLLTLHISLAKSFKVVGLHRRWSTPSIVSWT